MSSTDPFKESVSRLPAYQYVQVEEETPYGRVLEFMRGERVGAAVVCLQGKVTGIFTERDVLNKHALEEVPASTPVRELMTKRPATIRPESTIGQAIALMHKRGIRNLPVVDREGRPAGLLSVGRVIRFLAAHFPAEVVNLPPKPAQLSSEVEGA